MSFAENQFDVSIVMAVYNTKEYLSKAINSIITQDYGLDRIQIILVDDGSDDGSAQICDSFAEKYPDNILAIHKENGGQSSARNVGIQYATGKYVNFIDSDDFFSSNTVREVVKFLNKYELETDVAAIPCIMFGNKEGPHPMNEKFKKGTRLIDLSKEWQHITMSLATSFVRLDVAKRVAFNEDIHIHTAEDARETLRILMVKQTIGVVSTAKYNYRIHSSSTIANSQNNKEWYIDNLKEFSQWMLDDAEKKFGYVPKYIQYNVMRDLAWKFRQEKIPEGILNNEEVEEYKKLLFSVTSRIDDDVIMSVDNIWTEQKSLILKKKHNSFPELFKWEDMYYYAHNVDEKERQTEHNIEKKKNIRIGNSIYEYDENVFQKKIGEKFYSSDRVKTLLFNIKDWAIHINFFAFKKEYVQIEGWIPWYIHVMEKLPCLYIKLNDKKNVEFDEIKLWSNQQGGVGEITYKRMLYKVLVPYNYIENSAQINFYVQVNQEFVLLKNIKLEKYIPLVPDYKNAYYWDNGYKLTTVNDFTLKITKETILNKKETEIPFQEEIRNKPNGFKAVAIRSFYFMLKPFKKKQLWLFADKANRADDNAEAFFRYCCKEHSHEGIHYIFLVGKDTADYKRLKKIGKVVPYMSWKHKMLYLFADYIISAYSHDELNNPILHLPVLKDLSAHCKYVFLQHGVTKDDVSRPLNRMQKNIRGFVTAAKAEYDSIVNTPAYGYSKSQIWLTGFPRYDLLYHDEHKSIAIMPTWRRDLVGTYHPETSIWDLKSGFEESAYYQFYSALLNNEQLINAAKKYGYEIEFISHPVFFPYVDRIQTSDYIKVGDTNTIYRDVFARNKLLVTDYSSVFFDFAYLRKPIVYAHFDNNHYAEGYFDYERDGFGEVEYDLESTVNRIIEYMKNDCNLKPVYKDRIDLFFAFHDQNNSARVFEKIQELGKEG